MIQPAPHPSAPMVLGPDCDLTGDLVVECDVVLQGRFAGTLKTTGQIELHTSAQFKGTLIAHCARLAGRCDAAVVIETTAELLPGATVAGRIYAGDLTVRPGATFQGDTCIGPNAHTQADWLQNQTQPTQQPQPTPPPTDPNRTLRVARRSQPKNA